MASYSRKHLYIVTIRRAPEAEPEHYYVTGADTVQAKYRAIRFAKVDKSQVLEVATG
jgi:hypothetical protein